MSRPMLDARKGFRPDDPLRALGLAPVRGAGLADHRREEIAARLIEGEEPGAIVAALARTGADPALVRDEIARATGHPWVRAGQRIAARLAKRDWLLACRTRLEAVGPAEVPRRHALPPADFLADHYLPLRPVVLTGLVDRWPARHWTLERLRAIGDPEVEVQGDRAADPDFELNSIAHKRRMRWHAVLDHMARARGNDLYVTANNGGVNRRALHSLWRDVGDLPGYLEPNRFGDGYFWMGPEGTVTPWHHDLTHNFLVNMAGQKRVSLVSPSATPMMRNTRHCFSAFGSDATLGGAEVPRRLTVDIGPGEILFIPVGWWHHVEGLSLTIGLSFTNFVWDNDFAADYRSEGDL